MSNSFDSNHYIMSTGIGRIGFIPLLQGVEAKYRIIFKTFFLVWLVQFLKKTLINLDSYD